MATIKAIQNRLSFDAIQSHFPCRLFAVVSDSIRLPEKDSFYYGFIQEGFCEVKNAKTGFYAKLLEGMYFSFSSEYELEVSGSVVLFERLNYQGFNQFGGPIEESGRQHYIDSCKASLIIQPPHLGDPCLNLLTFPAQIVQSRHTHPSVRVGIIYRGSGFCQLEGENKPLRAGDCFLLDENEKHSFVSSEQGLTVIAFHPDSDWGPTHEIHPMINRTNLSPKN